MLPAENSQSVKTWRAGYIPSWLEAHISVSAGRGLKAADRRSSLDAAWILTNVAAGEHATAAAAVPAGPILVAHLGAGLGLELSQQCAWALGKLYVLPCLLQFPSLAPTQKTFLVMIWSFRSPYWHMDGMSLQSS